MQGVSLGHQARAVLVVLASYSCCEELLEGHRQSSSRYQEENQTRGQKAADTHRAKSPASVGRGGEGKGRSEWCCGASVWGELVVLPSWGEDQVVAGGWL